MDKALKDKYYAAYVKGVDIRNKMQVNVMTSFNDMKNFIDDVILINNVIPEKNEFDEIQKYLNTVAGDIDHINKFYFDVANS